MSFVCETCGKEYKTRSGLWKHQKKLGHGKYASDAETEVIPIEESKSSGGSSASPIRSETPPVSDNTSPPEDTPKPSWMDFDLGS